MNDDLNIISNASQIGACPCPIGRFKCSRKNNMELDINRYSYLLFLSSFDKEIDKYFPF